MQIAEDALGKILRNIFGLCDYDVLKSKTTTESKIIL